MEYLSDNFRRFFKNVNVGVTTEQTAAREYAAVKALLEDPNGRASALSPQCFLQGSYRQETAIHDLNDVDVVALCKLWQPRSEEHTSELQSPDHLVCRLLLEKKKKKKHNQHT